MSRVPFTAAAVLSLTAMFFVMGCGPDATAPPDLGQISLLIVSGNGQSGVVGTELPQPLVIKATNSKGAIIPGLTVNIRVTNGNGSMFAGSASTDGKGVAADYWTLGTSTAQVQRVEVRAVLSTGQKQVYGVFTATALPGPATQIAAQAGDGQTATCGTNVAIAPAVLVKDQYGNPVPNLSVTFTIGSGGGDITGATPTTSASGIATAGSWTLGSTPGPNSLTATATGSGISGNPVTFSSTASCGNFWTTKAPMPVARNGLAVAVISGILYAVGGTGGGAEATLEAYDPATDTWTTLAPMPTARAYLGAAAINGILYAVGGVDNTNTPLRTLEAYDPATNGWTSLAPMSTARGYVGVTVVNGTLYAVGGYNRLDVVEAYDLASDTWTPRTSMPTARAGAGVAAINGTLYAVGGLTFTNVATLEAYDPASDTWAGKTPMPTARYVLGAAAINGTLYAVGGAGAGSAAVAALEAYDPATDTWTAKTPMPTARAGLAVAVINGILYAVGGYGPGPLATLEAYHP